jgi:hypothetical protein
VVIGVGGQQVLIDDASANPIELVEPTRNEARLGHQQPAGPRYPRFSAARTLSHVFSTSVHAFLTAGSGGYPSFRGRRSGGVAARGENMQLHELVQPVPVRRLVSLYGTHDPTVAQ